MEDKVSDDHAARLLSILHRPTRNGSPNISLTAKDYKQYLCGLSPEKVLVDRETKEVKFVIVNKQRAEEYLKSRHSLRTIRGDSLRVPKIQG